MTDSSLLHDVLEHSPEKVSKKLEAFSRAKRTTERVFATSYLRYKNSEGVNYSVEDARQMVLASDSYDQAKSEEIKAEAEYTFERDRLINSRKQAELVAKGI